MTSSTPSMVRTEKLGRQEYLETAFASLRGLFRHDCCLQLVRSAAHELLLSGSAAGCHSRFGKKRCLEIDMIAARFVGRSTVLM